MCVHLSACALHILPCVWAFRFSGVIVHFKVLPSLNCLMVNVHRLWTPFFHSLSASQPPPHPQLVTQPQSNLRFLPGTRNLLLVKQMC